MVTQTPQKELLRVNPKIYTKIRDLGASDVSACFNCGTCTVSCPLSVNGAEFPRKYIRYAMLGVGEKILSRSEPWLCYYCGDCSDTCPSKADPGAYMAAARRYAIIEYSIGKIGNLFYSPIAAFFTYLVLTLFAVAGVWYFSQETTWNESEWDVYTFVSYDAIHIAGLIFGIVIFAIAFIQALIMLNYLRKGSEVPPDTPLFKKLVAMAKAAIRVGIGEGLAESRFLKCNSRARHIAHLAIFWGYVLTLIATSVIAVTEMLGESLLGWHREDFEADIYPIVKPIAKVFGVIGGILLMIGAGFYVYKRLIKDDAYSQSSHFSDWIFLLLTFFIGLSGFIIDVIIYFFTDIMFWAYIMYGVHLVLVFLLIVTAAFTKFAHMEYRLLAVWFREYQRLVL